MKVICVTGVPATGKTTIAKKLAKKFNFYYLDVNKLISKHKLSEGYDRKRRTKIVDIDRLNKVLINIIYFFKKNVDKNINKSALMSKARSAKTLTKLNIKKIINNKKLNQKNKKTNGIIIDSHLSHYLPRKYVDFCIVTKCDIKELNKRLKKKKFHKNKIQENLQAEIFDVCHNEALERKHNVVVINTTKDFNISSLANQLGGG